MFLLFYFRESIELGNTSFSQSEGEEGEILSESEEGIVTNTEAEIILQRSYDEISLKDISILLQTNIETAKESDISTESIDINDIPMPLTHSCRMFVSTNMPHSRDFPLLNVVIVYLFLL